MMISFGFSLRFVAVAAGRVTDAPGGDSETFWGRCRW
jgi:hypothetical protein